MNKRFSRDQVLTIPNMMSAFRLLLIPVYLWLYCAEKQYLWALAVVLISGITDVLDGFIARRFNMVSDLGKFLDPLADKLTQTALIISLCYRFELMLILFVIFAIKEISMIIMGTEVFRETDTVNSARWYGKTSTVTLEVSIMALLLFPEIPVAFANLLLIVSGSAMVLALSMYLAFYSNLLSELKGEGKRLNGIHFAEFIAIVLWIIMVILSILPNRNIGSIKSVFNYEPVLLYSILFMAYLFSLKSVCVVIYLGFLYFISGVLFDIPAAIAVNAAGTAIAVTPAFFYGKRIGYGKAVRFTGRQEFFSVLRLLKRKMDGFSLSLISRLILFMPSDVVSLYMGTSGIAYGKYLLGSITGLLPQNILFAIMGANITAAPNKQFTAAFCGEMILIAVSLYLRIRLNIRKKTKNRT